MSNVTAITGVAVERDTTGEGPARSPRKSMPDGYQTIPERLNDYLGVTLWGQLSNVAIAPWVTIQPTEPEYFGLRRELFGAGPVGMVQSIWDTGKFRDLLTQPIGSPVELTLEEAQEIIRLAFGRRRDLPSGAEFVEQVRELLGHSVIERLQRSDG